MGFIASLLNHKKKAICLATFGFYYSYQFMSNYGEVFERLMYIENILKKQDSGILNKNKLYVLVDNTNSNLKPLKYFNKAAAPIFQVANANYTVILSNQSVNIGRILEIIMKEPDSNIVLAGDDYFIHKQLNLIYNQDSQYLNKTTIGIMPAGRVNRFYDKLVPNNLTPYGKMSSAASMCLVGRKMPIYPILLKKNGNAEDVIVVDSVKSGELATYENMLMMNNFRYLSYLKYYACLLRAYLKGGKEHLCDIEILNVENKSILANSVNCSYDPIEDSKLCLTVKEDHINPFAFGTISSIYNNFDNSFLSEKDQKISHPKIKCSIKLKSNEKESNIKLLYDGALLNDDYDNVSIEQASAPIFNCYTPLITIDDPSAMLEPV